MTCGFGQFCEETRHSKVAHRRHASLTIHRNETGDNGPVI
jgi:hypothetical protein